MTTAADEAPIPDWMLGNVPVEPPEPNPAATSPRSLYALPIFEWAWTGDAKDTER